jgi:nucleolar protein 58
MENSRSVTGLIYSGTAIGKIPGLSITPVADSSTGDVFRAVRNHLSSLIPDLAPSDVSQMSLGLSHSISRHKLKFSPDKVDTMIIQAIALLDDLDKELNTYAMRVKEWYGWHFPEMAKIINDNLAYAKLILKVGFRSKFSATDLSEILPEEIEGAIKAAAEISMGTDITDEDLDNIRALADQVVEFTEYRAQLSGYLSTRMQAIAPNLTALVGDLVGARLIAHAGSLIKLAKSPASTIQILGAEKALFRALKTKHDTPKYGLIYHASLVGQATGKNKGKIARMLATKAALGLRVDSLSEWGTEGEGVQVEPTDEEKAAMGNENRLKIERRLRSLEGKPLGPRGGVGIAPNANNTPLQPGKWSLNEARKYNHDADGISADAPAAKDKDATMTDAPAKAQDDDDDEEDDSDDVDETTASAPDADATSKAARKAAKEARKADKAAKKIAKGDKKDKKEKKEKRKSDVGAETNGDSKKKRKREDDGESDKKEKKKKHRKSE